MTEILTESFCERCGTRYTFESARSRTRLKGVRVLSRGLKNFVLSDDTSMDEAMAAARSETDREVTAHQLDAFHKTFNFCMSCRQYTCPNCWNEAEARCLTCAPHLGQEVMSPAFEVAPAFEQAPAFDEAPAAAATTVIADPWGFNGTNGHHSSTSTVDGFELAEAEAALDLESEDEIDATARLAALTGAPAVVEPQVVEETPAPSAVELQTEAAAEVAPEPRSSCEPVAAEPVVAEPVVAEPVVVEPIAAEAPVEADRVDLADVAAAAIVADAVTAEPRGLRHEAGRARRRASASLPTGPGPRSRAGRLRTRTCRRPSQRAPLQQPKRPPRSSLNRASCSRPRWSLKQRPSPSQGRSPRRAPTPSRRSSQRPRWSPSPRSSPSRDRSPPEAMPEVAAEPVASSTSR